MPVSSSEQPKLGDRSLFSSLTRIERVKYFAEFSVRHDHLIKADAALTAAIRDPSGGSIILVYGPTRVGKTTMKERVIRTLINEMLPELEQDLERVPLASVLLRPPRNGRFSWNLFFRNVLTELVEPLIDCKRLPPPEWGHPGNSPLYSPLPRLLPQGGNGDALLLSLESAIHHRRPKAIIIDEAQHFGTSGSARLLQMHLDCIKSLADVTKTVHVLIGTYELLPFRNLSAQLSGRSRDIHFPRYNWQNADEYSNFIRIIKAYELRMPFPEPPDLSSHAEFLYENSIGCIGNLKANLVAALNAALEDNKDELNWSYLEKHTAFTNAALLQMAHDVSNGERDLLKSGEEQAAWHKLIGRPALLTKEESSPPKESHLSQPCSKGMEDDKDRESESDKDNAVVKSPKWRPGTRNPKRDPTGRPEKF